MEHDHTLGAKEILYHIETKLIGADDAGRELIIKSILRDVYWMLKEDEHESNRAIIVYLKELVIDKELYQFMDNVHSVISYFAGYFAVICSDLNIDIIEKAPYTTSYEIIDGYRKTFLASDIGAQNNKRYKRMERTHAIAIVNELLRELGVFKTIDRTIIAEFVEAVTGGNISVKGKDTVAYKPPTGNAEKAAKEYLSKIRL